MAWPKDLIETNHAKIKFNGDVEFIYDSVHFINYGLAYNRDEKTGELIRKPEKFGFNLGKDIFLGADVIVVRGTWRDTTIGDGCKIGNRVNVGHNVILGKNVLISPGVILCGSCEVGDGAQIGAGTVVKEHVKIGKKAIIGGMRYVNKDIGDGERF